MHCQVQPECLVLLSAARARPGHLVRASPGLSRGCLLCTRPELELAGILPAFHSNRLSVLDLRVARGFPVGLSVPARPRSVLKPLALVAVCAGGWTPYAVLFLSEEVCAALLSAEKAYGLVVTALSFLLVSARRDCKRGKLPA